jgi:hypothetical protein
MPVTPASPQTPAVNQPKHPLYALTTFELHDYQQQLERAIACLDTIDPVPEARAGLQARLDGVIAEQADRKRLAGA